MSLLDSNGDMGSRLRTWAIILTIIATIGGWAFTLGVVWAQVQHNATEISMLRTDSRTDRNEVASLAERTAGLEATMESIDDTLGDIRDEMRRRRQAGRP